MRERRRRSGNDCLCLNAPSQKSPSSKAHKVGRSTPVRLGPPCAPSSSAGGASVPASRSVRRATHPPRTAGQSSAAHTRVYVFWFIVLTHLFAACDSFHNSCNTGAFRAGCHYLEFASSQTGLRLLKALFTIRVKTSRRCLSIVQGIIPLPTADSNSDCWRRS